MTLDVTLLHYNLNKEIYVTSNARSLGLWDILLRKEKDGQLKSVHHALRMYICYYNI